MNDSHTEKRVYSKEEIKQRERFTVFTTLRQRNDAGITKLLSDVLQGYAKAKVNCFEVQYILEEI